MWHFWSWRDKDGWIWPEVLREGVLNIDLKEEEEEDY